jgi:ceramide glucosyltransferase
MIGVLSASIVFLLLAISGVIIFSRKSRLSSVSENFVPLTVLKPVCGLEPELIDNLSSFCDQDYPTYQIVFAVQDSKDPAISIIEKVIATFPDKDLSLVIDDQVLGKNLKASNLINMFKKAKYDLIVIADSDVRVRQDYLKSVSAPFINSEVGAATCLYSGVGGNNFASRLGMMFINDWFLPSALVSALFVDLKFCFGATMAIRREVLAKIGGFGTLKDFLADDYMLGRAVFKKGYKIALVTYIVENIVSEKNIKSLFQHEIRWARTIRSVQPLGYLMSFITEAFPIAILTGVFIYLQTSSVVWTISPIIAILVLRITLHYLVQSKLAYNAVHTPWLIPARDIFSLVVRTVSLFGSKVSWRNQTMFVYKGGRLSPLKINSKNKTKEIGKKNEKDTSSQPTYV